MPSIDGPDNPVMRAHRSRHGRSAGQPSQRHTSLADRDVSTVLQDDFLPPVEALGDLTFKGLDDIRAEHDRRIEQCAKAVKASRRLDRTFSDEDLNHERALRSIYANGTSPSKIKDDRTPEDQRKQQLDDAHERVRLGYDVAREWATAALGEARQRTVSWDTAILERQAGINQQIEELSNQILALKADLLTDTRLKAWVDKFNSRQPGSLMTFADLNYVAPPDPERASASSPSASSRG
jgi:hypothetical protein